MCHLSGNKYKFKSVSSSALSAHVPGHAGDFVAPFPDTINAKDDDDNDGWVEWWASATS